MQKIPTGQAAGAEFAEFMRAYQNMVYSTALRLTASPPQAEDIAQDVFIKAYEHFSHLKASPQAGGWLRTVATNLSLNHLSRYRKRWRLLSEFAALECDDDAGDHPFLQPGQSDELFERLAQAERRARIEAAIARLPAHQRIPLVLFHFEEMPYEEIAHRLTISLAKVKTDIHRGRARLAVTLAGD